MLLILLLICTVNSLDFVKDVNIYVLNNEDFNDFLVVHNIVLVDFYAPWCKFSQKLNPYFHQVADKLAEDKSAIKLAFVDATIELELAKRFNVTEYPTVILFKNGRLIPFKKAAHNIVILQWLEAKKNLVENLNSLEHLNQKKNSSDVLIIAPNKEHLGLIERVVEKIDDIQIGVIPGNVYDWAFPNSKLSLYRKDDQEMVQHRGSLTEEAFRTFVYMNNVAPVNKYSAKISHKVFDNPLRLRHFMVFLSDKFEEYKVGLKSAAEQHTDISFLLVDVKDNVAENIVKFFNVELDRVPLMLLSDTRTKAVFITDFGHVDAALVSKFITDVKEGRVQQKLKSQPLPDNWEKQPVKVLVGSNFVQVAYDKTKNVFVEFYAPWCGYCKQLEPIWTRVASSLASNVPDLVMAKMDKAANDIQGLEVKSYPTLKLYLKETNEVVDYKGPRNSKALKKFLSQYVTIPNMDKSEL